VKGLWIPGAMPVELILVEVFALILFLAGNYFLKKIYGRGVSKFFQGVLLILAAYIIFKFIIFPPIPAALLITYMGLITLVVFLLLSTTDESWNEFKDPIIKTLEGRTSGFKTARTVTFALLPVLAGLGTYNFMKPNFQEPIELRTVHPAPPATIQVHNKEMVLQEAKSPFRVDENGKYEENVENKYLKANPYDDKGVPYLKSIREGGEIFFQNCHFCHGDNLNGAGMFAFAFNPIPANFTDPGTIAQLQETFVFWRVSKGGIGLPREGFPWASAMPPWEKHLTTEEMWKVVEFEYWHTGYYPRTWE
jgi:hypothetical protein